MTTTFIAKVLLHTKTGLIQPGQEFEVDLDEVIDVNGQGNMQKVNPPLAHVAVKKTKKSAADVAAELGQDQA